MLSGIVLRSEQIPFLVYLLFCGSKAFLLDGTTQIPNAGSGVNDIQYNFLMEFMTQERQSRLQLETLVMKLHQQLTAVQSELTTKIDDLKQCGCADREQTTNSHNQTITLEARLDNMEKNYNALATQFSQLQHENLMTVNRSIHLEKELSDIKQVKSVSDLQMVSDLQNMTKHLEQEIQATNSRQASLNAAAEARNQDFIALFQKLQQAETDIKANSYNIRNKTASIMLHLNETIFTSVKGLETKVDETIKAHEISVQSSTLNIQSILKEMNNRAFLHVFTNGGSLLSGNVVPFDYIKTVHGISAQNPMSGGKFVCEKSGYYLVSFFISPSASVSSAMLLRNSDLLARVLKHGTNYYQTHSATVITSLSVSDQVFVIADTQVYSTINTGFTILQIA